MNEQMDTLINSEYPPVKFFKSSRESKLLFIKLLLKVISLFSKVH